MHPQAGERDMVQLPRGLQLRVELLHADATGRVVRVSARQGEHLLGSCLGEGHDAERAEDRAVARLLARLGLTVAAPTVGSAPADGSSPGSVAVLPAGAPLAAAADLPGSVSVPSGPSGEQADVVPRDGDRADPPDLASPTPAKGTPNPPPSHQRGAPSPLGPTDSAAPAVPAVGATVARSPSQPAGAGRPAAAEIIPPGPTSPADAPGLVAARPPASGPSSPGSGQESAPQAPPADPDDWSQELAGLELQLRRLGWGREQEAAFLERAFGHPSRNRLTTYGDLMAYLRALEGLAEGADPTSAALPLRRRDLLRCGDELLASLGWSAERGRRFLEEQLGQSSRQRLSDAELLRFNLLLEAELIQLDPVEADGAAPMERTPGQGREPVASG